MTSILSIDRNVCNAVVMMHTQFANPCIYASRGFSKLNPISLLAWQKDLNVEVILISEFMNSEVRITSN